MSTLVSRIQTLIKNDRIEQALKELEIWAAENDSDLHNTVIMQMARYNQLRRNERMGLLSRDEGFRMGNQIRFAVLSLLEDLPEHAVVNKEASSSGESATRQVERSKRPVSLFISYAREDHPFVEGLQKHLSTLRHSGHLASWTDSQILPGQEWSREIEGKIRAADIILYMISADFLASKFIREYEMIWAEEAKQTNGTLIVPVIVRSSLWDNEKFAQYNAIPRHPQTGQLVAISKWDDTDEAYLTVVRALKVIIDQYNS